MVDCPPKRGGDPFGNSVGSLGSGRVSIFDNQIGYYDARARRREKTALTLALSRWARGHRW
jgi:hypothetical protein